MNILTKPRWFLLILAALGMQVLLMLADVIFVTYYAKVSHPELDQAALSVFALETAGAFVFCFAPPVVYLIARWLCLKVGRDFLLHAGLLVVWYYVLDLLFLLAYGFAEFVVVPYLVNGAAMLTAALLAGWHVRRGSRPQAAA